MTNHEIYSTSGFSPISRYSSSSSKVFKIRRISVVRSLGNWSTANRSNLWYFSGCLFLTPQIQVIHDGKYPIVVLLCSLSLWTIIGLIKWSGSIDISSNSCASLISSWLGYHALEIFTNGTVHTPLVSLLFLYNNKIFLFWIKKSHAIIFTSA